VWVQGLGGGPGSVTSGSLGEGWRVGHWTDPAGRTGCTVVLPPIPNVAACDIRGSSPSSRELAHLDLDRRLTEIHGLLLTGGSAFGLASADGVMSWLEERGVGYETATATVPIVPAAVIFDLVQGRARPGPEQGRSACEAATERDIPTGRVGAGTGATVGKWAGLEYASAGGLGLAALETRQALVAALAVVNSVGDVIAPDGSVLAGTRAPQSRRECRPPPEEPELPSSTVLALVATDARLDKRDVRWLAARGADGITISVRPAHTRYDGDVVFAVSAGAQNARGPDLDELGRVATEAVAGAVRAAVAGPRAGGPGV
jgi:L-aminopeptidase/D-esterase-like protein